MTRLIFVDHYAVVPFPDASFSHLARIFEIGATPRALGRIAPDFFDEMVTITNQSSNPEDIEYRLSIPHGVIKGVLQLGTFSEETIAKHSDVRDAEGTERSDLEKELVGVQSFLFKGDYRFHAPDETPLVLGRTVPKDAPSGLYPYEDAAYAMIRTMMRALRDSRKLTPETIAEERPNPYFYLDRFGHVGTAVRDMRLAHIRAGDASLGEFGAWMHQQREGIANTFEITQVYTSVRRLFRQLESVSANSILHSLVEVFNVLAPPKNDRLEYMYRRPRPAVAGETAQA